MMFVIRFLLRFDVFLILAPLLVLTGEFSCSVGMRIIYFLLFYVDIPFCAELHAIDLFEGGSFSLVFLLCIIPLWDSSLLLSLFWVVLVLCCCRNIGSFCSVDFKIFISCFWVPLSASFYDHLNRVIMANFYLVIRPTEEMEKTLNKSNIKQHSPSSIKSTTSKTE